MRFHSTSAVVCSIALCGALAVPAAARGQVVKAGYNSTTITFHPESGTTSGPGADWRAGFVGGVSFLLPAAERAGLQVEALVGQTGARNLAQIDDALRLTTLSFPLLLHADVSRHLTGVYLIGGIAPTFNLHATYTDEGVTETVTSDLKRFDLGLVAGGGFERGRLVVEGRYTWGLVSLAPDDAGGTFKSGAFSVMAGFRFGR